MDLLIWFAVVIVAFLLLEIFFFRYLRKKRKFPKHIAEKIQTHLEQIPQLSPREQIIEYDKLLDFCLKQRGLSGTLGEKMKKFGKSFTDENAIWRAHKLRNKIAHEVGHQVRPEEFSFAVSAFQHEIRNFLK